MNNCIVTRDLSIGFASRQILHNINFTASASGITAIVGRSGSGKTTLLRQFNRLNETFPGYHASGSVKLDSGNGLVEIMSHLPMPLCQLRRRVGMVFQTPDVLPVSIRRNLLMPLKVVAGLDSREAESKMTAALKKARLWDEVGDRLDAPAESLSGGQKQRLCLARALALEPAILLLDEPTASLDVLATSSIEELLLDVARYLPLVMVTHNPEQAARLADNVAVLDMGRMVCQMEKQTFSPAEIMDLLLESRDVAGQSFAQRDVV